MTAGVGHNSIVEVAELKKLAERVENLITERKEINIQINEVRAEAKARGYDPKTLMDVVRIRAMDRVVFQGQRTLLDTYLAAFGIDV